MGARWLAAIGVAACWIPLAEANKKVERKEDDGAARAAAAAMAGKDAGWAQRHVAFHFVALGQKGRHLAVTRLKSTFQERDRPRRRGPGFEIKPLAAGLSSMLARLKSAALGRPKVAGNAIAEQIADKLRREIRLDPTPGP